MSNEELTALNESLAPSTRLEHQAKLLAEFADAGRLLEKKQFKRSLKKFRWVFANRIGTQLRLSTKQLRKFVNNYAPAAILIRRWRNDKERLLFEGNADSELIAEWADLNSGLGEKDRCLAVYRKLVAKNADHELLHSIEWQIWKRLIREKCYLELERFLPTLVWLTFLHIVDYDSAVWFPRATTAGRQKVDREESKRRALSDGALVYELALGLKMEEVAQALEDKLLTVDDSAENIWTLLKSAMRARSFDQALRLLELCDERFSKIKLKRILSALQKMPKSFQRLASERGFSA